MEYETAQNYAAEALPTILLVEDFDDTRLMMKLWLVKNGYRVVEAETGEEAISVAQRELPDLIIMDMMMPGMNGLDATHRIREHQALRKTPIVAVSAYGADEYRTLAIAAGCDEYVSTPFEPAALNELIKAKKAGKEPPSVETPRPSNVINLMDALRRSVEGETKGEVKAKVGAILAVLAARGVPVSHEVRARDRKSVV